MHVLILGGSAAHLGGVEAFCERSAEALKRHEPEWRVHRVATETAFLNIKRIPAVFAQLSELVRYRRQKPDITWVQYVNLPDLIYVLVARLLGMKVLVTPHLGSNWRSQSNPVLRRLSRSLLGLAHRIALISETQQLEILLPKGPPRSLIRNFLPEKILTAELPAEVKAPRALQLIHSARLSADKGTFLVVEVSAKLRNAGVPFVTRITGGADPVTLAKLDASIAEHDLEDQVKVLGRVPENELLARLKESDVLIHLSRIDSYPLILLEAMACSMVPVAMELAGARDMVETYGGAIVSEKSPVEETAYWLINADLTELRQRGRVAAGRVRADYSWDRCAGALADALEACVAGSRATTETVRA